MQKVIGDGALPLAVGTGTVTTTGSFLGFLNGNAPAIGILLTLVFGCIGIYFQWKRSRNTKPDANEKLIFELRKELTEIKEGK